MKKYFTFIQASSKNISKFILILFDSGEGCKKANAYSKKLEMEFQILR